MCPRATKRSQRPAAAARGEPAARRLLHALLSLNALPAHVPVQVHAYLAACVGVVVDTSSMHNFTETVLAFWRRNWRKFPTWAKAASIIFSMTPNSARAERVFSSLKLMFGDARTMAMADLIEGSLMLKYNNAKRKAEK